ncbi:MAG: hypothetical protein R3D44_12950 [Hyphomicrobiaceae bacterium]
MSVKMGGLLLALGMLAILATGLWYRYGQTRRIVGTGTVRVTDGGSGATAVVLRTRVVAFGSVRVEEVERPGGSWIDCGGDCAKAAREAGPDFWETVRRNAGGR